MSDHPGNIVTIEDTLVAGKPTRFTGVLANDPNYYIKRAIWIYFFLLLFEGGLRKWVLPALSTPLLIIRDPVAIWILYKAWQRNLFPSSIYLSGMVLVGLIGTYTAVFVGHGSILVALFGARVLLIHFPLIFIIGRVFTRQDIIKMGNATLITAIPMVILIGMQFYSPQSAWVNRGIGGDIAGAGFGGAGDFFRPPGTFSFTNGTGLFFGWLAPFVFYFWLNSEKVNRLVLIGASVAMLASIPFSISRTLLFEVVISLAFTLIATVRKPQYVGKIMLAIVIGIVALAFLSQTHFFKVATGAFTNRFDSANEQEGGLVKGVIGDRFLGGLISAITGPSKVPFFGYGLGMGTNVGSMLLTGTQTFLIAEGEWARLIGELGLLMGLMVISLRVGLAVKIANVSYKKMIAGDLLPWILLSFGLVNLTQAGWAQPTSLGFCIMISGLMLASINTEPQLLPVTK